jgi:hypothetical protein
MHTKKNAMLVAAAFMVVFAAFLIPLISWRNQVAGVNQQMKASISRDWQPTSAIVQHTVEDQVKRVSYAWTDHVVAVTRPIGKIFEGNQVTVFCKHEAGCLAKRPSVNYRRLDWIRAFIVIDAFLAVMALCALGSLVAYYRRPSFRRWVNNDLMWFLD